MTRLAFISDIHYGQLSRTSEFSVPGEPITDDTSGGKSLKDNMIDILKQKKIDYLCIAGDLTSSGSPQEFYYCEKLILDLAKGLDIPEKNIILGLGNHDIDWRISEIYTQFESNQEDFPQKLIKEKYRQIATQASTINLQNIPLPPQKGPAPFSGILENDHFVMFILNTGWYCTNDQAFSHGELNENQLKWFKSMAEKYKDSSKWKIILMHHHTIKYSYPVQVVDLSMVKESSEFLDIAGKNNFHLILHGHRHHPRAETCFRTGWGAPITFVCAGSFAVKASHRQGGSIPNTLHIIELTDELGILNLYNYQYSAAQGWIPFSSNTPETPLDRNMRLGKLFSNTEIENAIRKLTIEKPISWDSLEDCLKFQSFQELNKKIENIFDKSYIKIGNFPDDIILMKR